VYEATAIEQVPNALGRYGELRVYYPPATVMSDHPFCILKADWITPEKAQAAQRFVDYLLARSAQELALTKYGFRPADRSIDLAQPDSPFTRYTAYGFQANLSAVTLVEVPRGEVLDTLMSLWSRVARR
jgi:ABC-type sulfate transport system substrate-binding protein